MNISPGNAKTFCSNKFSHPWCKPPLMPNAAVYSASFLHKNNPVVAGYVEVPDFWRYSSATDYCGRGKGLLDILFIA